jgi:hypothetical protein
MGSKTPEPEGSKAAEEIMAKEQARQERVRREGLTAEELAEADRQLRQYLKDRGLQG